MRTVNMSPSAKPTNFYIVIIIIIVFGILDYLYCHIFFQDIYRLSEGCGGGRRLLAATAAAHRASLVVDASIDVAGAQHELVRA